MPPGVVQHVLPHGDFTPEWCCVPALPSPANCLAFCLSYLLTIYALLLVPVQDFIGLFKVLIVLSIVLALYSLFIQVVDEHGERSQELRQAKEREWQTDYYCKCERVQPKLESMTETKHQGRLEEWKR